jgi:superfamily I DNA/RNA helicase
MPKLVAISEWAPKGIDSLEDNALTVVRSTQNYSVVAGPGAGKTELLAQRASFLLETGLCPMPRRILAISFKRDASKNLKDRVHRRSGNAFSRRFDSYTFDAFAKGIVDQFLPALPQRLRPTAEYDVLSRVQQPDVEDVIQRMSPPSHLGTKNDILAFARMSFFEEEVPRSSFREEPKTLQEWATLQFWYELLRGPRSKVSFDMIRRLAGHLLQSDPRLLRAYRAAYSHVLLDEFQDTTAIQYWLIKILFKDTDAVLTAVGDYRQKIMGWADQFKLKDVIGKFKNDFSAIEISLQRNHRASQDLAPLVRFLAEQMYTVLGSDNEDVPSISPGSGPPPHACSAHFFSSEANEAEWIATEIRSLIDAGISPRDIALLARNKPAEYMRNVIEELKLRGVVARLEDALQELLSEPVAEACVLALRALACAQPREHWSELRTLVGEMRDLDTESTQKWQRLEQELINARSAILRNTPAPSTDKLLIRAIIRSTIEPFLAPLRSRHLQYTRGSFYEEILDKLSAAIACEAYQGSWHGALDSVEGTNAVPILSIHKSKGLEYEAVFFVGLEDGAFWNFHKQQVEEMNTFFVAVSRAKRRVVFTFSSIRHQKGNDKIQTISGIEKIYDLMRKAEVHVEHHAKNDD